MGQPNQKDAPLRFASKEGTSLIYSCLEARYLFAHLCVVLGGTSQKPRLKFVAVSSFDEFNVCETHRSWSFCQPKILQQNKESSSWFSGDCELFFGSSRLIESDCPRTKSKLIWVHLYGFSVELNSSGPRANSSPGVSRITPMKANSHHVRYVQVASTTWGFTTLICLTGHLTHLRFVFAKAPHSVSVGFTL